MKMHLNAVRFTVVFALLLFAGSAFGQLSKVHYIPPISISEESGNNSPFEQWIYISTPNNSNVQYVIKPLGGGADIVGLVSNSNPAKHSTRTSNNDHDTQFVVPNSSTGTVLRNRGYVIEADQPIYISVRLASDAQAGALVSKGNDALGQNFLLGSFANVLSISSNDSGLANFFSMLATEDNTTIQVQFPNTVVLENYSGTYPLTFTLNKNESYVGLLDVSEAQGNRDGLLGAKITSDKPIAVNTGSAAGTNGPGSPRDFGIDQIVDTRFAGKEYIFIRGVGDDSWENVMIVPVESNTSIKINGGTHISITGAYYEIDGSLYDANGNMFVESDKPVVAYQSIGGAASQANQGMFFVPPLSCSSRGNVDNIPLINEIGSSDLNGSSWFGAIGIVAKTGVEVLVNEAALTSGTIVSANNAYTTYLINNLQDGTYSIKSNDELYVSYYNYSGPATSGSFYSGFVSNPILQNNMTVTALGTCVKGDGTSNTTFTTSSGYDSYEWQKYNDTVGNFEPASGTNNQSVYEPTIPGQYRLLGKLSCFPTKEYISDVITVSVCPDDYDSDGIPDTIDLDRDNDGVLNMFESLGNGTIDFSSPLSPSITLPNDPASVITSTASFTPISAAISGDSNGKITSAIPLSGLNEKTSYSLNPILPTNQPLNIRLSEVAGSTINEFETITLSIYPTTENISLLDPGQKLLVDNGTGFKRVPQEGVSGNQIKFKYNPSPLDASKAFEILGIDIEGIDIIHELDATASSDATFNILVEIIDCDINTDSSDEIDALDDDSDNDSCPDKTESGLEDLFPSPPFTFNAGTVNARGMINLTGMTGYPSPAIDSATGKYLYLTPGTAITLSPSDQPSSTSISEGDQAVFSVGTVADSYQWQMNGLDITDDATFSGTTTNTLTVNTVDTSLDGEQFSVLVNSNTYLCKTPSNSAALSVLALPPIPVLDRVYSFCGTGTVANLKSLIDPAKIFNVYDEERGGTALLDTVTLINGEDYYVSAVNAAGGESVIRSFTTVVVATPNITADKNSVCFGESIHLTVNNAPQTVTEFMAANPSLDMFLEYSNSTYFYDPKVQTWNQADAFIKGLGPGATMYQINTLFEHEEVWKALMAKNHHLSGRFWIGLKQREELKGTPKKVDAGWYWLDGRVLDPSWTLWYDNPSTSFKEEPNDSPPECDMGCAEDGDEDYGQFNFNTDMGKYLNDIGETNGNSRAIVEFQGVTQVKWYKKEPGKTIEEIVGETSNSLTIEPSVTGNITYSYRFLVNGFPCGDDITITVNPLPAPLSADPMELCDNNLDGDPTNTNQASFNLAQQRKDIISKNSAVDRDVFFYETNSKALSVSDSIDTAALYTSNPKDIYYRVVDKTTGCFGADVDIDSFALIVNDLPPILTISDLHECDDASVGTDKDGLHGFDLTQKDTEVKDALIALGKDPADYTFTYHALKNDTTPIITYTTVASDASEKEIFVRIEDKKGCIRYDNSFKVIVDKLPEIKTPSITLEQCESDGQIKYNLNSLKSRFSANSENETFEFNLDASFSPSTKILNPENFVVPVGVLKQDVFIKISNSSCERFDDLVYGVREPIKVSFVFGANTVLTSFVPLPFTECDNFETSPTPGFEVFDPSIFTQIKDEVIASAKNEGLNYNAPNIEISFYENEQDAIYQKNKIDTAIRYTNSDIYDQEIWVGIEDISVSTIECLGRFKVADLKVRPNPIFELPEEQVFCQNLGFDTIYVTNPSATYTYNWARNGTPISSPSTQNLRISEGGTYTVTATNPVTGCNTAKVINVYASEIASFMPEDISVFDLTGDGSNRIEIQTSTLGIGDYEFALNDNPFQDSPIFEEVPPGIHTLSVRDKNGCGLVRHEVSVIGYAFYFTPNNDGKNDTWQVSGVSDAFQAQSLIYIFDRHGRLMAQIPANGDGWDGTYNGTAMPADDYWFRVKLEDGRSFTGHFSLIR